MTYKAYVLLCVLFLALPLRAAALEARVESRNGVPTLLINGEPVPPMILWHRAGGSALPLTCQVTPDWQQFSVTFRAPYDDDNVAVQISNVAPVGDWFVDDARFFVGTLDEPLSDNMLKGGDFEGEALPQTWVYSLDNSAAAPAEFSLDSSAPQQGKSCLRVHITSPGTVSQRVVIQRDKQYTFAVWLRASENCAIEIQAVHNAPPWTVYGGDAVQPEYYGEMAGADHIVSLGAERGLHISEVPIRLSGTPYWKSMPWGENPDYAALDAQIEHIVAIDPEALIIPRITLNGGFIASHPDQVQVYNEEGPELRHLASPASKPWRQEASATLRRVVQHLEKEHGDHILGYHVGCQCAWTEWFYDWAWKYMPCFEEPFRQAFAEWAKAKYQTVEALRQAWQQPEVTFDTIRVPSMQERLTGKLGAFRDPRLQRFEIDFAEYMQVCQAEYLEEIARVIKEETNGQKLTVFFYGYLYDVAGFGYGGAVSGHLRLGQVLNSPYVDVLCAPASYFDRGSGGVGPFMAPVDSVQLHSKLWLNEEDIRTHLVPRDEGCSRTENMAETLGVYRRGFAHQFERRSANWWWWCQYAYNAWMTRSDDLSRIFDDFGRMYNIWREAPQPQQFQPQVAIITDEDSFFYLRNSSEITGPSVALMRRMFNTMGCPVGLYLMDDLCEGNVPDSVRFYVFLNAYRVTSRQRQQLRAQVARDNKTALWLYAPGFIEQDASADNISDLIGFEVTQLPDQISSRVKLFDAPPAPLNRLPGDHNFGVEDFEPIPLFAVKPDQAGLTPLGTYEGTAEIALAMRRFPDWTSVFCGGLQVSTDVLREFARYAGAHIYCETNDVISASPGFISIHATTTGSKTLIFPEPVRLRDLISGEIVGPRNSKHTFSLQKGETRLFAWSP